MKLPNRIRPFLITLSLCCAAPLLQPLSAAPEPAAAPVAWHVSNAELRAPVKVDVKGALLRMPPQVYLADLEPLETTDGLAFDPLSKSVSHIDVRDPKEKAATIAKLKQAQLKPKDFLSVAAWEAYVKKSANAYGGLTEKEGGPMLRLKGSVTVALKPEYQFFAWRGRYGTKVFIDGKLVRPDNNPARYWQKGPKDLDRQLRGVHDNRPLVVLGLNGPADAGAYAATCNALLNGPYPVGEGGETVMGNLLVTDPGGVLERIAPQDDDGLAWVGRMAWLVDGAEGADAAENLPAEGKFHASDTAARFGEALTAVLAKRLDNHDAGTEVHDFELGGAQIRWVAYLKGMEGRIPGITGIARGLLATVAFGLVELADAPNCKRLPVTPAPSSTFLSTRPRGSGRRRR